jgi:hypothetical protein
MATVNPSELSETDEPDWSFIVSPSMSDPNGIQSARVSKLTIDNAEKNKTAKSLRLITPADETILCGSGNRFVLLAVTACLRSTISVDGCCGDF